MQNEPQRKTWTEQVKGIVHFFHDLTGMEYTAIGKRALKNPRFWSRMEQGGTITLEKADQLLAWLAGQGVILTQEGEPYDEANRRGEENR